MKPNKEHLKNKDRATGLIPFHFDIPEHSLPLNQFIEVANSTREIIDNFNYEVFDGKLKYQILVIPPKEGSFLEILGIAISIPGSVLALVSTDIGKEFILKLTGYDPIYWAGKAGEKLKEFLLKENQRIKNQAIKKSRNKFHRKIKNEPPIIFNENVKESINIPDNLLDEEQKAIAIIVAQITLAFMQKEQGELRRIGLSKKKYRAAYSAKNKIYNSCIVNTDIKGLGFDMTDNFPIRRSDFPKFITEIPPKEEDEDEYNWTTEIKDIKATSPNWDREDTQRQWKAKYNIDKFITFTIEDEAFWKFVKNKAISTETGDVLKVQWAFVQEGGRRKYTKVLRVLEYNGKKISSFLSKNELLERLTNYSYIDEKQIDLFSSKSL